MVKVTINGDGIHFEKDTDIQKAGQIIAFLGSSDVRSSDTYSNSPSPGYDTPILSSSKKSPRNILQEKDPATIAEKITVLAYFLEKIQGEDKFTLNDIKSLFTKSGERLPKNFGRDMKTAVTLGYICPDDLDKGCYYLTNEGLRAVESKFADKPKVVKKSKARKNGVRKLGATNLNESLKEIEIDPNMSGVPLYYKLPSKADKILWILNFAKENNIESLSAKDAEYISDRLDERILAKSFFALNKRNIKSGYVIKDGGGKFKIQKLGIDYLQGIDTVEASSSDDLSD